MCQDCLDKAAMAEALFAALPREGRSDIVAGALAMFMCQIAHSAGITSVQLLTVVAADTLMYTAMIQEGAAEEAAKNLSEIVKGAGRASH